MTNEEAIRVLNVAKAECEWNAPLEYQEAFKMAIEALKEQSKHDQNTSSKQPDLETLGIKTGETCADAISRRDAIEELSYLQTYLFDSRDHDNKVSLEDVRYAIEQLPSVQSKQLKVLADVLDGCPLTQPCDRLWKREGWCKEHCKPGQQEPDAECWLRYAEVMAADDT